MKSKNFIEILDNLSKTKTCYATGAFGAPVGAYNNRKRYSDNTTNKKVKEAIEKASADTFLFDCIGLGKSILWGFDFNINLRYGGATYKSHDVPDFAIRNVKKYGDYSEDFTYVQAGEWLVNDTENHVGYADGNGGYYDISQSNENYEVVHHKSLSDRKWKYHCKMQWIDYEPESVEVKCPHCGKLIKIFVTE